MMPSACEGRANSQTVARMEFRASTEHLESLGAFIRQYCAESEAIILVELAINEIAVNAIRHGQARHCCVSVNRQSSWLTVIFEDDGVAFNPLEQETLPSGELREHGYGMLLIQVAQREMRYHRRAEWNVLEIDFQTREDTI
jgi:anti-sigma regulatory factor (Ser/Thr protein kinase)